MPGDGPAYGMLAGLPVSSRTELLAAVAGVLPYYSDPNQVWTVRYEPSIAGGGFDRISDPT